MVGILYRSFPFGAFRPIFRGKLTVSFREDILKILLAIFLVEIILVYLQESPPKTVQFQPKTLNSGDFEVGFSTWILVARKVAFCILFAHIRVGHTAFLTKSSLTQPMDPEDKSLNFIFPTKHVIPKSLKFSHWLSEFSRFSWFMLLGWDFLHSPQTLQMSFVFWRGVFFCATRTGVKFAVRFGQWYCWWFRNPANHQLRLVVEIPVFTRF